MSTARRWSATARPKLAKRAVTNARVVERNRVHRESLGDLVNDNTRSNHGSARRTCSAPRAPYRGPLMAHSWWNRSPLRCLDTTVFTAIRQRPHAQGAGGDLSAKDLDVERRTSPEDGARFAHDQAGPALRSNVLQHLHQCAEVRPASAKRVERRIRGSGLGKAEATSRASAGK